MSVCTVHDGNIPGNVPVSEELCQCSRINLTAELPIVSDDKDPLRKGSISKDDEPAGELVMWIISENKRLASIFSVIIKLYTPKGYLSTMLLRFVTEN